MPGKIGRFLEKVSQALPLILDPQARMAMLRWPVFSKTSFCMVSTLCKGGIRPRTVIDVGANVGQFTVAAANIFKCAEIYAFEPIPRCAEKLRSHTSGLSNVHIVNKAVGDRNAKADFYLNAYDQASSLLQLNQEKSNPSGIPKESRVLRVDVTTLDAYLSDKVLQRPALLKIDVQGAERLVVEYGRKSLKEIDYVVMEVSFESMYEDAPLFMEMVGIMKELDFTFLKPVGFIKGLDGMQIIQADILFKNNAS